MSEIPIKFPRTPHLTWLGADAPRDDKVLLPYEMDAFFSEDVVIEEKVDGANIGMMLSEDGAFKVWNRGTLLGPGSHSQFNLLWPWLTERQGRFTSLLTSSLVLFGEWCFAKHSIHYTNLPDWFLLFDVYDLAADKFWSVERRNDLASDLGLYVVPQLAKAKLNNIQGAANWICRSKYANCISEGIYVRQENTEHLVGRAKLVNPAFTQQIFEHWSSRPIQRNELQSKAVNRNFTPR